MPVADLEGSHAVWQLGALHVCPGMELLTHAGQARGGCQADVQPAWQPRGHKQTEGCKGQGWLEDLHDTECARGRGRSEGGMPCTSAQPGWTALIQ